MLVILKRGGILFIALIIIVTFLIFSLRRADANAALEAHTVVIDAGHGDPDSGAVGDKSGVPEKDLNLDIACRLYALLCEKGEAAVMTRTDGRGLYTSENASVRDKKREDMKKRAEIAAAPDSLCLVSIHMNHFTDPKYFGPQIFYAANVPGSEVLAAEIRKAFLDGIGAHCTREIKPVKNDLYLLRTARVPAVIVECGFLSNPEEEALLNTEDYRQSLAAAIANGIENFKKQA